MSGRGSSRGRWRDWSNGRPVFGLHCAGVGLTRYALGSALWGLIPWSVAAMFGVDLFQRPPNAPTSLSDDRLRIPAPAIYYIIVVLVAAGFGVTVLAIKTYRDWGRWMTTRYQPPRPAREQTAPASVT